MEAIFDTVIGNILVLLAIVGGIAGFIKDRKNKESESSKRQTTPLGGYQVTSEEKAQTISVENTQQGNWIKEQQNTHKAVANGEHDALAENKLHKPSREPNKKNEMRRQIKKDLSRQGLVSGIIMNEVLGPPRAMKPYKSVTAERKR